MRRLRTRVTRFRQISPAERILLLRVAFVIASVRAALWVLPLEATRRIATWVSNGATGHSVQQLVWAVTAASRYVPAATCLPQALAVQALLANSGYSSRVEIGVAKDERRRLEAHAWVTCGDRVIMGGADVARYAQLTALEA